MTDVADSRGRWAEQNLPGPAHMIKPLSEHIPQHQVTLVKLVTFGIVILLVSCTNCKCFTQIGSASNSWWHLWTSTCQHILPSKGVVLDTQELCRTSPSRTSPHSTPRPLLTLMTPVHVQFNSIQF